MSRTQWMRSYVVPAAFLALLAFGACSEKGGGAGGSEKAAEKGTEEVPKPEPKKPLSAIFAGSAVTLPAELAKVTFGMSTDEAKKVAPDLYAETWGLTSEAYEKEVTFSTSDDDDTKTVMALQVTLPKQDARALIEAAWGKGKDAKDSIERPEIYWFNPEMHVRAVLEEGYGEEMRLEFTPYMPVAEFLGTEKGKFGWEKSPVLGADIASLRANYPQWLHEEGQKEAEEQRKKVEAMAGADLSGTLGAARPSARFDLPPTEWDSYVTSVHPSFDDAGKVSYYWAGLPFEAYPAAKEEIFELLKKIYGTPEEFEDLGDKAYLFLASPRVTVKEDTISKKWDVKIEPAAE